MDAPQRDITLSFKLSSPFSKGDWSKTKELASLVIEIPSERWLLLKERISYKSIQKGSKFFP